MKTIGIVIGFIVLAIILFLIITWLITVIWGWVVPDVFAGMVEHGLLPASITFFQAFKISVLLTILGLTNHASIKSKSS